MNKFSLPLFLDTIFFLIAGFFLSYPFFKGFITPSLTFLCAFCFAIIIAFFCNYILRKKANQNFKNKTEKEEFIKNLTQINLMSKSELFVFFKEYLVLKRIAFNQTRLGFVLPDKKVTLFFKFGYEKVEKVDVVKYFNLLDEDFSAVIITNESDTDTLNFAKRFNGRIILYHFKDFYLELKKLGFLPPEKYILLEENPKIKLSFSRFLKRKNAKNFLVFGVAFSVMSFFVPIKIYYLVWSGIFLSLSLITKLYGRDEKQKTIPV